MKTNLPDFEQLKDKTFIIRLTVSQNEIQAQRQIVLKNLQADFQHQGFRKGSVPLDIIEKEISPDKLIDEIASQLLSTVYSQKIKEHHLRPIVQPQIDIINPPLSLDKDWQVKITSCELPQVTVNPDYPDQIKKVKPAADDKNKLDKILTVLVKSSSVDLPSILIAADIKTKMSKLIDQTTQAGITVSDYLKSQNQTLDQYQVSLKDQITKEWTLNLAIDQIAKDQKLQPTPDEIKSYLAKSPSLSSRPDLATYFLTQQKVLDYLQNL